MSDTSPNIPAVGILDRLRTANQVARYADAQPSRALATPFAGENHLAPAVVLDDIFRAKVKPVTRAEAMSIPSMSRGRNLICTVLARQPLVAYRGAERLTEQPGWLVRSKYFPPRLRMLWTIDDCIFYGWSLWVLDRGAADQSGRRPILDAYRVDPQKWRVSEGRIVVRQPDGDDWSVPEGQYLLIPGPAEGILTRGADTIRAAKDIEELWMSRVRNPTPIVELRFTDPDLEPTDAEMRKVRADYIKARQDPDGTVMVTQPGLEVVAHGDKGLELFTEGRNAVSLDNARLLNIDASMIDASQINGSSVDYENNGIGRSEFYDVTLRGWALPIEEALSQDDALPAGQYVQFDMSGLTTNPDPGTGPVLED